MLCPEMETAPERKRLDPKWTANKCDAVCTKIWKCAAAQCSRSSWCGEDIKMFGDCVARTPGASACGIKDSLMCPEPE
jgi:hypothetical protein